MDVNLPKTNAVRALDKQGVSYTLHTYDTDGTAVDALTVAQKVGVPIERVYKTLIFRSSSQRIGVAVINGADELDLKKTAKALQEKSIALVEVKELLPLTGYVRGGCSPLGMKKAYPTLIDDSVLDQSTILVSAGRIGQQIELWVNALIHLTNAYVCSIKTIR
jgi:Cys-tRNA(Pro)/Cys-tRNA(Cys) deacylase